MIGREVIAPRLSRLALVALIALVATVGAVACASLVADERDRIGDITGTGLTTTTNAIYAETSPTFHATASTLTTIQLAIVTADRTYEIGVTLPGGEHHDVVVCPGGNPWPAIETRTCTTYDFPGVTAP